jgi:hypothetical protein
MQSSRINLVSLKVGLSRGRMMRRTDRDQAILMEWRLKNLMVGPRGQSSFYKWEVLQVLEMPYRRSTPSPRKSFPAARIGTSAAAVVQLFLPLRQRRRRVNAPTELLLLGQVGKAGLSKDTLVVRHANFALRVQHAGRVDGHGQIALDTEAEIDVFGLDGFVPFIDFLGRTSWAAKVRRIIP